MRKILINKSFKQKIIKFNKIGLSIKEIAKKCNLSYSFIQRFLKNEKIKISPGQGRRFIINEEFFNVIDTEEKAYFLGFLYADGCNYNNRITLSLKNGKSEIKILKKLESLIYTNNKISDKIKIVISKNKNKKGEFLETARLTINSKYMANHLEKLGCVPKKSLILKFPNWLNEDQYSNFIRGYFDGDGTISFLKNNKNKSAKFAFAGSYDFLSKIKEIFKNKFNHIHSRIDKYKNIFILHIGGNRQIAEILDWLYDNSTIFLDRKYKLYLKLLKSNNEIDQINRNKIERDNKIIQQYNSGLTYPVIAKNMKISLTAVADALIRNNIERNRKPRKI